jgi:hypothetical protein
LEAQTVYNNSWPNELKYTNSKFLGCKRALLPKIHSSSPEN